MSTVNALSSSLTQADFLKVLVAQYSNQIPTDSQDSNQFYKDMMDLSNFEATQDVDTKMGVINSSQMVGKTVTATDANNNTQTGTVTQASFDGSAWSFTVNGSQFTASQITNITAPTATSNNSASNSSSSQ